MLGIFSICCFFFKQKTAYEMRISDWSSDVCSSDLRLALGIEPRGHAGATTQCNGEKVVGPGPGVAAAGGFRLVGAHDMTAGNDDLAERAKAAFADGDFKDSGGGFGGHGWLPDRTRRSEEHTSELASLMRFSYAALCYQKKNPTT